MNEYDLNGIDAIAEFSKQRHENLLKWRNFFGFPIKKIGGIWRGNQADLQTWARERGRILQDITDARVSSHYERARLEAAAEAEEEIVSGTLGAVSKALGDIPLAVVQGWLKAWADCPIRKLRAGFYEVSKAAFRLWLSRHPGLMKKGSGKFDIEYSL